MLLGTGRVQIQIYKEEILTSVHFWCISQDVGNCHDSLRVVLWECQSLTSALTSVRGPLWLWVLSSQSLCAVTGPCICDSDKLGVSGVGFFLSRAALTRGAKPYQIQRQVCCDPASHREIRLTLPPAFSHSACQELVCHLWTQRMSSTGLYVRRKLWYMF